MKKPVFVTARRKRLLLIVRVLIAVAAVSAAAFFFFTSSSDSSYMPYREFYAFVEQNYVEKAKITDERIYFRADVHAPESKSISEYPAYTENPHSPTLYETLLLHGVSVTVTKDAGEIVSLLFDALFYIIFFGSLILVFRKFISPNTFKVVRHTGVTFSDVVGMDELKAYMQQVMQIMKKPAEYASRGIRAPKGVLLEGAPGNGKTLFARALAGEAKVNFIPTKATDFESMFMAIGPMKVKLLFRKARRRAPCIVFIDEFDGIGTRRNYSGSALETENTRIVTALLNELDGFEANGGILVLAATNSISALDPALIRPGRFDLRVQVPYPDAAAREKLVELYLRGKQYAADVTPAALVRLFDGASAAQIESALNGAVLQASKAGRMQFVLGDVQSALQSFS